MGIKDTGPTRVAKWVWAAHKIPEPVEEYRFTKSRKWRFDFSWPEKKVALEVEGGVWGHGRHVRGRGYERDCEKYSVAAIHGWKVIRCLPADLKSGKAFALVRQALGLEEIET